LARRYGVNPKTVAKWKKRTAVADLRTGPREPKSTVLTAEEEAVIVAFRRHTLLPLDDCLYALQPTIPHLTRSSLHRCLQRHGIGRLPDIEGDKPAKKKFKSYPIGFFHIDIAEVVDERADADVLLRAGSQFSAPGRRSSRRFLRPMQSRCPDQAEQGDDAHRLDREPVKIGLVRGRAVGTARLHPRRLHVAGYTHLTLLRCGADRV
jgi:hypothetical protein